MLTTETQAIHQTTKESLLMFHRLDLILKLLVSLLLSVIYESVQSQLAAGLSVQPTLLLGL